MRVLLVYFNPARDLLPAPPIGLAYVASATERAGHEVRVLDLLARERPGADVAQAVRAFAPHVVGISVRNIDNIVRQRPAWHLGELAGLLAAVRREGPVPIVLGGPAVSVLGATALNRLDADFAVVGEGEETFPALLSALEGHRPWGGIPGLCYRDGGAVRGMPPARLPRFGASGMERWVHWPAYERRGGTWAIQTKRGCPLHCCYCAYPGIEGHAGRMRPPEEVVDEIEHVMTHVGPRTFELVDSTFNVPPEPAAALCREIIRRGLDVRLTAMGVNPLGVSESLFTLMRQAGFNSMMITPEAASDPMLRTLRKGFTVEDVRRTATLARSCGIASAWFFMLGGPGETRETVEQTVSFVERHLSWRGCVSIFMTGIRILPGTELQRRAVAEGHLAPDLDLAEPAFYLSPAVDEDWILSRISRAIRRCPAVVHAAEEGRSTYERLVDRALGLLGVAPPYWRFLPLLLRVPPVPTLRQRYRPAGAAPTAPPTAR
ncbi:MAG: cobalamin B12-binding domain-containing protein [Candidatus Rokubacteria bacterium]|nr:cobalamin B12-binding domain-containing protein [Candidatus Rokubacteria bacterium]